MTLTEFRALAERAKDVWGKVVFARDEEKRAALNAFTAAASPTAILALIERLERAEAALRPFADYADDGPKSDPEIVYSMLDDDELVGHGIPIGHYRRAAAYFDAPAGEGEG